MPSTDTLWSRRLVRQTLAVPNTPDYTNAEEDLATLVHQVLQHGNDQPILEALDRLQAQGAHRSATLLEFWAETCASTRNDLVFHNPPSSEDIELEATLFLVPIWRWQSSGSADPGSTLPPAWLESLCDHFVQSGRIPPDATLMFFPQWYTTPDLPMTWSGRRHWLDQALQTLIDDAAGPGFPQPDSRPPSASTSMQLHWLIGLLIGSELSTIPWLEGDATRGDEDLDWSPRAETLETALPAFFPGTSITIYPPGAWAPTFAGALAAYQRETLLLRWSLAGSFPDSITLTPDDDETTWTLTWPTPDGPSTFRWLAPTMPSHDALLLLVDILHAFPIPALIIQASA